SDRVRRPHQENIACPGCTGLWCEPKTLIPCFVSPLLALLPVTTSNPLRKYPTQCRLVPPSPIPSTPPTLGGLVSPVRVELLPGITRMVPEEDRRFRRRFYVAFSELAT
ncbi:MAG TPA: hypothetical protein VHK27_07045, partial [Gammaproteobacteria bacterium]|nr:hypothetical protein [Gammaproteobacteria bacterium]